MALYDVKNLSFKYNQSNQNTLNDINFDIKTGDFVLISGGNGSGKSTLIRLLKKNISTYGKYEGKILFENDDMLLLEDIKASKNVGYLCQNIDEQIVTDKVYHELAFPLENFGTDVDEIRIRVAEISAFFNIEHLFFRNIKELSGGQKQIINIASLMTLKPKVILLDEPTSQLDPIGRQEFIDYLDKINKYYGTTIIIIEHNIDEIINLCNKIMFLDSGSIKYYGNTREVVENLSKSEKTLDFLPTITKLFIENKIDYLPLDIREAKQYISFNNVKISKLKTKIEEYYENINLTNGKIKTNTNIQKISDDDVLKVDNISFRYSAKDNDILKDLSLDIKKAEIIALFGGNGCGKTTLFKNLSKVLFPYNGKVLYYNQEKFVDIKKIPNVDFYKENIIYLPQDVKSIFIRNSVREELLDSLGKDYIKYVDKFSYDFTKFLDRHPYDLSGGEMQMLALLKIINGKQKIILFDEPTKALDAYLKNKFIDILFSYKMQGITIMFITHDVEFANMVSDRCAMLFNGEIISINSREEFFKKNFYWTTTYNKLYAID